jgi:DegV family protein with EDD domain
MIHVVTDSTANLPNDLARELRVEVVPLHVIFGNQSYRDGIDISNDEFYTRLRTATRLPTTSQPAVGDFCALYDRLATGSDRIVSIHVTGKLSGTYESAVLAGAMFPPGKVTVVETNWITLALAFQVQHAVYTARQGGSVADIVTAVHTLDSKLRLYFVLDTLENLQKGGRISSTQAFVGGLLQVKPILKLEEGVIKSVRKQRSISMAIRLLLDMMGADVDEVTSLHVGFIHARAEHHIAELEREIRARFNVVEALCVEVGPTLGAHVGAGAIGLVYYWDG